MHSILNRALALVIGVTFITGCNSPKKTEETADTETKDSLEVFGQVDGTDVYLYKLENKNGVVATVTNYGGLITSLMTPDKNGKKEDVVLGYDNLDGYLKESPYFGALVGRYGNRIAKGKFTLDGKEYTLAINNGPNSLHGGDKGFDKVIWAAEQPNAETLKLTYTSPDMEEGYPGNLDVEVTYTLNDNNELKIDYKAVSDKKTVINLTQHSYFNLTGNTKRDILDHEVMINADKFVPVDSTLIPVGELKAVEGTPFDFRETTKIGARINQDNEQLKLGGGYDHCWVLNKDKAFSLAATVHDPESGRTMEVYTTEPGLQFYSGNFLDGSLTGKYNTKYAQRYGFAMETEHYPDSPNQPQFPTVELDSGAVYTTSTVYKFSTK